MTEQYKRKGMLSKGNAPFFIWLLLGFLLVFLSLNRHSRADRFTYHSEIWADKAGYQIYLSAFEYDFDGRTIPDTSIVKKTGYGFSIDTTNGVILTKYTYGTALAQLPFYLVAKVFQDKDDPLPGFSVLHNRMISLAASLYLLLGLIFLYQFLLFYFERKIVVVALAILLFGTNLLYYGIQETGMSHVYSFTVFAGLLLLLKRRNFFEKESFWEFFVFGCLAGWIVVLRQSNVLFPLVFFFLDARNLATVGERVRRIFRWKNLLPTFLGFALLLTPQILYWTYAFDSMVAYSYGDEGFNWLKPQFHQVFFNPYNGLFLYAPVLLFMVYSMLVMVKKSANNAWLLLALFVVISYVFASWWAWWFGCAFGARSYVEYLALFSLAIAYGWKDTLLKGGMFRISFGMILVLFCVYTTKMTFSMEPCFPGAYEWDWPAFWKVILAPMK